MFGAKIKYQNSFSDTDTATDICKAATYDEVKDISFTFQHNTPSLMVILKGDGDRWGISNIALAIDECPSGCDSCSSSLCLDQKQVPISITWTTVESTLTASCGGYSYQYTTGNFMEIHLTLDPHNTINSAMKSHIANADNPTLTIKVDNQIVSATQSLSVRLSNAAFFCFQNQILEVVINDLDHTNPTITFRIEVVMVRYDAGSIMPLIGIKESQLFIKTVIKQIVSLELPFEGCLMSFSELFEGCSFCVRSLCLHCNEGWEYIQQDQRCQPICGDGLIVNNEECDDENLTPYDGCQNCKFSCPQFCQQCVRGKCIKCELPWKLMNGQCLYVCDQILNYSDQLFSGCFFQIENFVMNGYYYEYNSKMSLQHTLLNNANQKEFRYEFLECEISDYGMMGYQYNQCIVRQISYCKKQLWNKCLECQDGYQLAHNKQYCETKCKDNYKLDFETCDDGNNIQFDGCFQCESSCQLECLYCINQECLYCKEGWYLIENQCLPICGDGITVPTEQCDDNNQESGDGCFECKAECSNCKICNYNNKCQVCEEHFELVSQLCQPICGDKYIEPGLEECDDGNEIQDDGCYNCQLECYSGCKRCYFGLCTDICSFDELYVDGMCVKEEINVSQCSDGCQDCIKGQCVKCKQNFQLLSGVCQVFACGNGIREIYEECDDGNILSNDGCSKNCTVENNWTCLSKDSQSNTCYQLTEVNLEYLNVTRQNQFVQLSYSKKVRLNLNSDPNNFLNQYSLKLLGLQEDQYQITCLPKIPIAQDEHRSILYEFQIILFQQILNQLNFNVFINDTVLDENDIAVTSSNVSIQLKVPKILTASQSTFSQTFRKVGYSMMISLSCSSVIMLLLGEFAQTVALLDILQYQQYLKYLNVDYPYNVYIYFESSNFITLQPLLNQLNFIEFYQNIVQENFQQSIGKFKEYELNADLLTNIDSLLFQLICGMIFLLILCIYEKLISKHIPIVQVATYVQKWQCKLIQSIFKYLYKYKRKYLEISKVVNINTFIQFFYANSWDLIFKVFLFLISNTQSQNRQKASLLICISYLGIMIKIFLFDIRKNMSKTRVTLIKAAQLEKLILFKKFSFHFLLTWMQYYPITQCILIPLFISSYVVLILGFKLKTQKIEILTTLSLEIPIILCILMNIPYCEDFQSYFSINSQIYIGFAQIGLLILSLIGPLVQTGFEFYCKLKKYLNSRKQTRLKEQQNKTTTNIFIEAL
ncbi:unnamed protein product (macronuclear) [Paramecium tetraurelia]|uniref:TNFR-Cys domain-containing protein n=1 Tax=Paramecium tetraurelia TaxID=5888 RepID=A0DLW5_PARTE|nr:uncharacterized protein GSPATT00039665001 [Paramecium tetraurelia]CAK84032.1 unnamed protein product [Paramecium tetraurelia]|eukprot:XP_001451429.1 hypothetical protein (macronuclear) [Paramecium tetraurelia strain d4-2]